jgi:hypothetical protein
MPGLVVTTEAVDAALARRGFCLGFPRGLEHHYEQDRAVRRARRMRVTLLETTVIYNCFLVADWLLVRDMLQLSFILHFFVAPPLLLLAFALQDARTPPAIRDGVIAIAALAIGAQILTVFMLTEAPGRRTTTM